MNGKLVIGVMGVSSDHHLATQIGVKILRDGGNAFDAAIAVSAVLSVVQPHMGGPGGDGFLLGFIDDEVISIASPGRAPRGFNVEKYIETRPTRGPLTVTIPGLVYLWGHIHDEYATMPLDQLLKPAIDLAYSGFHVGLSLAEAVSHHEKELEQYKWSRYYRGLALGNLYSNRDMARALRIIASRGWGDFYYGTLAEEFVSELQDQGVDIGLDDLMEHESYSVKPLRLNLDNKTLYELPPNTQGISTLQLISALHELEYDKEPFESPSRVLKWSKPVENVYRFRDLYLGDPDYMKINPENYVKYGDMVNLLSGGCSPVGNGLDDTTFFVVSDGRSIVGFIQSLFYSFGSGLVASGFPIQNRAIGFTKSMGLPNSPAPRKLPLHTLSILAVDDEEKYIIGCVGGDLRPQLHLRIYENIFVYNMRIDRAVAAPRFVYTRFYNGQEITLEEPLRTSSDDYSAEISIRRVDYQSLRGHVHVGKLTKRGVQLACDPRSEGLPLAT